MRFEVKITITDAELSDCRRYLDLDNMIAKKLLEAREWLLKTAGRRFESEAGDRNDAA